MSRKRSSPERRLTGILLFFFFLAFLLLSMKSGAWDGLVFAVAVPAAMLASSLLIPRLFPADQLMLSLTNFLCAFGLLMLYDTAPALAYHQAVSWAIGLVGMIAAMLLVRRVRGPGPLIWLASAISLILLALPFLLGREINGARNWVDLGFFSFQPSEIVKPVLVLVLACFMARRRFLPWLVFTFSCLALLMLQRDLGAALLYYCVALLLFWISSGSLPSLILGLCGGAAGALWGYEHFAHVQRRVQIWINPWKDYQNAGYQIVQSLVAIASGGLFGVGLGLGAPTSIPIYTSDFIFSVICEQFGLIFGICVLLVYGALLWRGAAIAMEARRRFHALAAMGATLLLGLQTFLIIGGVLKLIPLTGVTLPFVSYGGTSLVSSMCLAGLIQGVDGLNKDDLREDMRLNRISS